MAEQGPLKAKVRGSIPRAGMFMEKFEFFEHTADVGVKVFAQSLPELFENSALALNTLLTDYKPNIKTKKRIILKAASLEELLVTWLNELLYLTFSCDFLPASYSIEVENKSRHKVLKAEVLGQEFDSLEGKINTEIKAATYHNLIIKRDKKEYTAEIVFDV